MRTALQRFEEKYIPEPNSGCWLWTGSVNNKGYGKLYFDGRLDHAHRVAYELLCEPIPTGLVIRHKCDTPACVNPGHMLVGTKRENSQDMAARKRSPWGGRNGRAKIDADAVQDIRTRRLSAVEFAALYGIGPEAVRDIWNGRRWRQLEAPCA